MVKILLDFPWGIESTLNREARPLAAIRDYESFRANVQLYPVQFIEPDEYARFRQRLAQARPAGGWIGEILRFAAHHVRPEAAGPDRATIINGPADPDGWEKARWERALRSEIGDTTNWRTPQIVVSSERSIAFRNCIHDQEVSVQLQDRPNPPHRRVTIVLNSYSPAEAHKHALDHRRHKYAWSDLDPWDVRYCNAPAADGTMDERCRLPRPSSLRNLFPWELGDELRTLRSQSWPDNHKYWFIPPETSVEKLSRDNWRKGAFKEATANGRKGPIDYKGQVWAWHPEEGHWDVQLKDGKHQKVKSNGDPWK